MSHPDDTDPEPVDTTDEPAEIYVADPDDYAKTRKLKALNDAKSHVRKKRKDRPNRASKKKWDGMERRLAEAVASYGHELLPILEDAEQAGILDTDDYYARGNTDIRTFTVTDGMVEVDDGEFEHSCRTDSMAVYRHLQKLERKLGLGLQLDEKQDDEWEVEV